MKIKYQTKLSLLALLMVLTVGANLFPLEVYATNTNSSTTSETEDEEKEDDDDEKTSADYEKEQQELQEELDELNEKVDELENQQAGLQNNISSANSALVDIMASIAVLEAQIEETKLQIEDAQINIEAAQAAADEQYRQLKLRMKYTYENDSQNSVIAILFEATSIADFLNRIEYANTVYQYDQNMLDMYEDIVATITELKAELEMEQASLEVQEAELAAQQASLNAQIAALEAELGDISSQLATAQAEADKKAAEKKKAAEEAARKKIEEQSRRNTQNQNSGSNSGGSSNSGGGSGSQTVAGGNPPSSVDGNAVVAYARQFVGNPYVWGGTSLTNGADCSGFVMEVYKHFGYLNSGVRWTSAGLRTVGQPVGIDYIQPGDIVCYAGHVAIYMGNGKIVEAQSTLAGITDYRSVYCHNILAIRRL